MTVLTTNDCVLRQLEEGKMMERRKKIALELSDLVIYCRPVPFDEDSKTPNHFKLTHTPFILCINQNYYH